MIKEYSFEKKFDKKEYFLLSIFFILLMLKPGFGVEEWEVASLPMSLIIIQNFSIPLALVSLVLCLFIGLFNSSKIKFSVSAILIIFLMIWYNVRSYQFGSNDVNSIIAIFVLIINFLYFSTFTVSNRYILLIKSLGLALSIWLILNFLLYIFGYGYATNDNSGRFFGSTPHPNSFGAFSLICMSYFLLKSLNKYIIKKNYLNNLFLALSVFMVFISGSRSAIVGAILIIFLYSSNKLRALFSVLVFSIFGLYSLESLPNWSVFSVLNRIKDAPLDNRNEVWTLLIEDFYLNPIIGSGDYSGVSGSGYLTAFGGTGMVFGFLFIILVCYGIYKSIINFFSNRENSFRVFFYVLFFIVSFLSFFEGFVFDKLAFIQVLFLICFIFLGPYIIKKT